MSKPLRALVADDEPHVRTLLSRMLAALGVEVVAEAADGEEAVRLFRQLRPNFVVLDVNMPKLGGVECLQQIRAIDAGVHVVMLTAQDALATVQACMDGGVAHYILKTNPAPQVFEMLRAALAAESPAAAA